MKGWFAAAGLSLAACTAPALVIQVAPPESGGSVSMVVAYEADGPAGRQLEVVSAQPIDAPLRLPLDPPGNGRLVALLYDQPLDLLRIPVGRLDAVTDAALGATKLPIPIQRAFTLDLIGGRPRDWQAIEDPFDAPLAAFRFVAGPEICAQFKTSSVSVDATKPMSFLIPLPGGTHALIGSDDGTVARIDASGRVEPVPSGRTSSVAITSAVALDDGAIWFGDRQGWLWRGREDALPSAERVVRASSDPIDVLDVTRTATEPFEAYAITRQGVLIRVSSELSVSMPYTFTSISGMDNNRGGGVIRIGPGKAVAAHAGPEVVELDGDQMKVTIAAAEGLSELAMVPELGLLVGSVRGRLLRRRPSGWVEMEGAGAAFDIFAIAPFRDGYIYGGNDGLVGTWLSRGGFCSPSQQSAGRTTVKEIVRFPGEVMLLGGTRVDKKGVLPTLLRPQ